MLSLLLMLGPAAGATRAHVGGWDGIKAVVVRSWHACTDDGGGWTSINDNWNTLGSIPVTVDFSDPTLCGTPITYDALVSSGADVVIFSDPCGGIVGYSLPEMDAFRRYAQDGHSLVGTYGLFGNARHCSNARMAPLFGYRPLAYPGSGIDTLMPYRVFDPTNPLLRNLPNPFQSEGVIGTPLPPDGTWSHNELAGAVYLAKTGSVRGGVISVYTTSHYSAIYISNMPEYFGGPADSQLLYNAIIYPNTG